MHIIVYFGDKPVFLCNDINDTIHEYMHHPDAVFIDEVSPRAIKSLLHEIAKSEFHAGILYNNDLEQLKKVFFRQFDVIQTGGGVVYNEKKEILMIFRRGKWDLPKGKLDKGESIEDAAIREVKEETGLSKVKPGRPITVTYHTYDEFGKHILKESHWYKMTADSTQKLVAQQEEDITEIRWVNSGEMNEYLQNTYSTIKDVLEAAATKSKASI